LPASGSIDGCDSGTMGDGGGGLTGCSTTVLGLGSWRAWSWFVQLTEQKMIASMKMDRQSSVVFLCDI